MTRARPYNREAALDAAMNLFWQKGYHATTLKDLESALRMRPGSIYAAFTSKERLFNLALERYQVLSCIEFADEVLNAHSPLQALADYLRRLGGGDQSDPQRRACMVTKTLIGSTAEDASSKNQAAEYLDQMESNFVAAFERARDIGEVAPDADIKRLARRYQSTLTALKIESVRDLDSPELARSIEEVAQEVERLRPTYA